LNNLRNDLRELLFSNPVTSTLYQAGFILIFIYPVLNLIQCASYSSFLAALLPIAYAFYLIAIVTCLANSQDWAIGAAFGIKALTNLLIMCRYFTMASFFYFLLYAAMAGFFIYLFVLQRQGGNPHENTGNMQYQYQQGAQNPSQQETQQTFQQAPQMAFCPGCGQPIEEDGLFCPHCGTRYENNGPVFGNQGGFQGQEKNQGRNSYGGSQPAPEYSGPFGQVALFCSGLQTLVFTVLLTASILFSLILNHSLLSIVFQIPGILCCIACWIIYVTSTNGTLKTTGFSLINGVLILELVLYLIPCVIGMIAGLLIVTKAGDSDFAGIGIFLIIFSALFAFIFWLYLGGFRKSIVSAREMIQGRTSEWKTSMFCIVVGIISAVGSLISTISVLSIRNSASSYVDGLLSQFSYYLGSDYLSDTLSSYIQPLIWGSNPALTTISSLLGIAVQICVVVLLLEIRKKNREYNSYS
jgi:hypothetical protein